MSIWYGYEAQRCKSSGESQRCTTAGWSPVVTLVSKLTGLCLSVFLLQRMRVYRDNLCGKKPAFAGVDVALH
jgi:hypothetical protein